MSTVALSDGLLHPGQGAHFPRGFRGGYRLMPGVRLIVGAVEAEVRELSPQHLVAAWPAGVVGLGSVLSARLCAPDHAEVALDVRLGPPNLRDRPGDRGFEIVDVTRSLARELLVLARDLVARGLATGPLARPAFREVLDESRRRSAVVGLMRHGACGKVRANGAAVARARPLKAEAHLVWEVEGPELSGSIEIELQGHNSIFVVHVDVLECTAGVLTTSYPTRMQRVRYRNHRRVEAPAETFVELRHPLWPDAVLRRSVRELSAEGLSFHSQLDEDLLYPELFSTDVVVESAGERTRFSAEVRSIQPIDGSNEGNCGIRLLPESAADEQRWLELVDKVLHPTTDAGSGWARATWDLFERAGYFGLSDKHPGNFKDLANAFESASRRIAEAPNLACQAVWPRSDGEVDGTMSMMKVYSSSWLVFQLAKVTGPTRDGVSSRDVLRDLHLRCYEHAQRDPNLRWLAGIPQVKPIWSRAVHHDLPERYLTTGKASITRFRAFEVPCSTAARAPASIRVGEATPHEVAMTLAEIARTRPRPYVEALDFVPERFEMDDVRDEWQRWGFARRRTILVAREFGVPLAAAILESADDGVHLFRLLDSVRMFPLAQHGERAFGALLQHARGWYLGMNKSSFIAFLEDEAIPADCPEGCEDLGLADYVVLSADLLNELLEGVYEITAPRAAGFG